MVAEPDRSAEKAATAGVASGTVVRTTAGAHEELRQYDESDQAQNCAVEYSVDVPLPQIMETGRSKRFSERIEERVDVLACGEEIQERIVEEIIDTPTSRVLEESIEAVRHFPGKRVQDYTVEQIADMPVSRIQEKAVEVIQFTLQDRMSDRIVELTSNIFTQQRLEQTVDLRISRVKEETVEGVKHVPEERVQCLEKTVDVSNVRQARVPTVQAAQKIVAVQQVQFPDRSPDAPVLTPGTTVQSELCYGGDGKPRARCVQISASNVAESQSMLGRVKSFRDKHCLITSDCVQGDISLAKEEITDEWTSLQIGVPLRFRLVPGSDKLKACSSMVATNFSNASVKSDGLASHYDSLSCDGLDEDVWYEEAACGRRQLTTCPGEKDLSTFGELKLSARGTLVQRRRVARFHYRVRRECVRRREFHAVFELWQRDDSGHFGLCIRSHRR